MWEILFAFKTAVLRLFASFESKFRGNDQCAYFHWTWVQYGFCYTYSANIFFNTSKTNRHFSIIFEMTALLIQLQVACHFFSKMFFFQY